jgi:outer membrane protein assembly factor BamB
VISFATAGVVSTLSGCNLLKSDSDHKNRSSEIEPSITGAPVFQYDNRNSGTAEDQHCPDSVAKEWEFLTGNPVLSSPTIMNGRLYFGSTNGTVFALNAATGDQLWQFNADGAIETTPAWSDDCIVVGGSDLRGIDKDTGEQTWVVSDGLKIRSSPAIVDDVAYCGTDFGLFVAIDVATGEKIWRTDLDSRIRSSPAADRNFVYISTLRGSVLALNRRSGEIRWEFDRSEKMTSSPTLSGGNVIAATQSDRGTIYMIDADTGEEKSSFSVRGAVVGSCAVKGDTIYFGTWDRKIRSHDIQSGDTRWVRNADGLVDFATVTNDHVLAGSSEGKLYAIDGRTGETKWTFQAGDWIGRPAIVLQNSVFFGSNDGSMYCIK